jgi:hypothetical protein
MDRRRSAREQVRLHHGVGDREVDLHAIDRHRPAQVEHELARSGRAVASRVPVMRSRWRGGGSITGASRARTRRERDRQRLRRRRREQQIAALDGRQLDAAAFDAMAGLIEARERRARVRAV